MKYTWCTLWEELLIAELIDMFILGVILNILVHGFDCQWVRITIKFNICWNPHIPKTWLAYTLNGECSVGKSFVYFMHGEAIMKLLFWKMALFGETLGTYILKLALNFKQCKCNTIKLFNWNTNAHTLCKTFPHGTFLI